MTDTGPRPDAGETAPQASGPRPRPHGAVVKRRWRVFAGAGGGAVVIAVAGAIALGSPDDQSQSSGPTSIEQPTPDDRS